MTVKARVASIRLIEKIHRLPDYAERLGLSVQANKGTSNKKQRKKQNDEAC